MTRTFALTVAFASIVSLPAIAANTAVNFPTLTYPEKPVVIISTSNCTQPVDCVVEK